MRNVMKTFINAGLIIGLIALAHTLYAQAWEVPTDKSQMVAPFKFDDPSIKKGEDLFKKNCLSCHGEPAKANFAALTPSPGDPASDRFQKQTDGALFFKITEGRAPMPQFKEVLTEEERWHVIAYFRSFNKSYVQPQPVAAPKGAYGGMDINVVLKQHPEEGKIWVVAEGFKDGKKVPLAGVQMMLYAQRYFGNLQVDETKTTDAQGMAYFEFRDSIPGDSAGNITFIVKLNADGLDGFKQNSVLKAGVPTNKPSLIATRAMWTVREHAPIWLIAAYSLAVIAVWSVLIYIIRQIIRIRKSGQETSK